MNADNGQLEAGYSIDEILNMQKIPAAIKPSNGSHGIVVPEGFISEDEAQYRVIRAEAETVEKTSAFFIEQMMNTTSALTGDLRACAQAIDDAITHFLVQLRQSRGTEACQTTAAILIHNIALFLDKNLKATVRDLMDQVGDNGEDQHVNGSAP